MRVCPVRVTLNGDTLGAFTSSLRFQVPLNQNKVNATQFTAASTLNTDQNDYTNASSILSVNSNLNGIETIHKTHTNTTLNSGNHSTNHQQLQQLQQQQQLCNTTIDSTTNAREQQQTIGLFGGAIRRFQDKIITLYSSRKRFTDQQKAIFWMVTFLLLAFIFAALLSMFMR